MGKQKTINSRSFKVYHCLPNLDHRQHVPYLSSSESGVCLSGLHPQHTDESVPCSTPSEIIKSRRKIGYGVVVSLCTKSGDVTMHNRSDVPVFVTCRDCDEPQRLRRGCCAAIFNFKDAKRDLDRGDLATAFSFPPSARVCFGKGWGSGYVRQNLFQCPCWMELYFEPDAIA